MGLIYSYSFATGEVIMASEVNQNFDDVAGAAFSIGDANMDAQNPIGKDKIADRGTVFCTSLSIANEVAVALTSSFVSQGKIVARVPTGGKLHVCQIDLVASQWVNPVGPTDTVVQIKYNSSGDLIGNTSVTASVDGRVYTLKRSNPFTNPLLTLTEETTWLDVEMKGDGAAGEIKGCSVTFWMKSELIAA